MNSLDFMGNGDPKPIAKNNGSEKIDRFSDEPKVRTNACGTKTGNMGKGRKKGVPNRLTKQLKEMILGALDDAGGQDYLTEQARENPKAFLALLGRVLPTTIKADDADMSIAIRLSERRKAREQNAVTKH